MNLLLDTHAFLWWIAGSAALSLRARRAIENAGNPVFVSAASAWEIATKCRIGKLPGATMIAADLTSILVSQGFTPLPISLAHGRAAGALPGPHKDPFDRMLMAQAMLGDMSLVSDELQFDVYGVRRLW